METITMFNPENECIVYCPVCGYIACWSTNVVGEPIIPEKNPEQKCPACNHKLVLTPEPFKDFYIPHEDYYEECFLNQKYILENYVFSNPEYNRDAHIKQLSRFDLIKRTTPHLFFSTANVTIRIEKELLGLNVKKWVPYNEKNFHKIYYCPRCGRLEVIQYFDGEPFASDEYKLKEITKHCKCGREFPLFSKERKSAKMLPTEEIYHHDGSPGKGFIYLDDEEVMRTSPEPQTMDGLSPRLYNYFWKKYVDIPSNEQLDRRLFEKEQQRLAEFWERGGFTGVVYTPKKQKDASVVGRAVVGGLAAGPAGAVVGAASAINKNMKNNK